MDLSRTVTTDRALDKSPSKRKCLTKDEMPLKNFDEYTQTNCLIDGIISGVWEDCGCVGRERGKALVIGIL